MKTDVAIIGGGPGGAAAAMFLKEKGISSIILEKARFPRYHIGESMTGECGNVVRLLGLEDRMLKDRHPVKWGTAVIGPGGKNSFYVPVMARCPETNQLMENFVWQVRRSTFDQMMLDAATSRGVEMVEGEATAPILGDDGVAGVRFRTKNGTTDQIDAEVVLDCSGQHTFLSHVTVAGRKDLGRYAKQVAIFSQVEDVGREMGKKADDTLIYYLKKFHWAWWIPLDDKTVSVGVVVPADYFAACKESKHDFLVRELKTLNPDLARRMPEPLVLTEEARAIQSYSYQVSNFTGKGFICIGDAHRFIDPIFSLGICFTTNEAMYAASAVADYLAGANRDAVNPFLAHEQFCEGGMDTVQELIDAFWEQPLAFSHFVHHRYRGDCIDIFAGRVYMDEPSPGLRAMRAINAQNRQKMALATAAS